LKLVPDLRMATLFGYLHPTSCKMQTKKQAAPFGTAP
jgi:hypothetical protein